MIRVNPVRFILWTHIAVVCLSAFASYEDRFWIVRNTFFADPYDDAGFSRFLFSITNLLVVGLIGFPILTASALYETRASATARSVVLAIVGEMLLVFAHFLALLPGAW